jgi:5-formyltetrahydrofolate cyclo-ligase
MNASGDKETLRTRARQARRQQVDKDGTSARIMEVLMEMPAYRRAERVLWYVGARDEVRTAAAIARALADHKTVAVPYCVGPELKLFCLQQWEELAPGAFGILEPAEVWKHRSDRVVPPERLDLVIVPGVAFDRRGGRLGYGAGYYDRLLAALSPRAVRVGVGYRCQLVESVPMADHDVRMDWVVTETGAIACQPARGLHVEPEGC